MTKVRTLGERIVPPDLRIHKWNEPTFDPESRYPVGWGVKTNDSPLFFFSLQPEDRVKDATIVLHQFEKWRYGFRTIGIFRDQQHKSLKTLARFTDVAEKNFCALDGN